MVVRDAEGASKFIRIDVRRAKSIAQARKAALCIANSNLFKTAMYGENPNFGRIVAALGSSGIGLKEKGLKIKASSLKKKDIEVLVLLGQGNAAARVYTSDLTPEYIKINAAYN
jgi:glutamate N-acetyltransferase/amino-acid N-acetyltransferase